MPVLVKPLPAADQPPRFAVHKDVLANGLRVVTVELPHLHTATLVMYAKVGSRYETPRDNGLSHFLEHLVFKGTRHRNALQIAESLETLGGSLNAFTSREHTCFTARILDEHLPQAVDVVADLVCHPTLTQVNVDRAQGRLSIVSELAQAQLTEALTAAGFAPRPTLCVAHS